MSLALPKRFPPLYRAYFRLWQHDARRKYERLRPHLPPPGARLLEVGSGPGSVVEVLRAAGHQVTPLDVVDVSARPDLRPVCYGGQRMPFADDSFAVALLLTTLHHTADPDGLLREAARVAPRLLVIEDTYRNAVQRRLTHLADSLTNFEWRGHPHTNRPIHGWTAAFEALGLTTVRVADERFLGLFRQTLFVAERR